MLDLENLAYPLSYLRSTEVSRILCLRLQERPASFGIEVKRRTAEAIAESFLKFSPRIAFCESDEISSSRRLWLFIDTGSMSILLYDEEACARDARALGQALGFDAQFSFSDAPFERDHGKELSLALPLSFVSQSSHTEPYSDSVHFNYPVALASLLIRHSEQSLKYLLMRMDARNLFAQTAVFIFHCANSNVQHRFEIKSTAPTLSRDVFETLLEDGLSRWIFKNPIRAVEIHLIPFAGSEGEPFTEPAM